MKKNRNYFLDNAGYWLRVVALGLVLGFALQFVRAWTEPIDAPPNGNVGAPLNTGILGQYKEGGLMLNTGGATNGLIVQNGNVGIGTATPSQKLDVAGGVNVNGGGVLIGNSTAGGNKGAGTINADQVCIRGVCQTTWPTGGTTPAPKPYSPPPCTCSDGTPCGGSYMTCFAPGSDAPNCTTYICVSPGVWVTN